VYTITLQSSTPGLKQKTSACTRIVAAIMESTELAPIRKITTLNHLFPSQAAFFSWLILAIVDGDFFA
jgi:hypothetical protein